jgi:hypothetical protein
MSRTSGIPSLAEDSIAASAATASWSSIRNSKPPSKRAARVTARARVTPTPADSATAMSRAYRPGARGIRVATSTSRVDHRAPTQVSAAATTINPHPSGDPRRTPTTSNPIAAVSGMATAGSARMMRLAMRGAASDSVTRADCSASWSQASARASSVGASGAPVTRATPRTASTAGPREPVAEIGRPASARARRVRTRTAVARASSAELTQRLNSKSTGIIRKTAEAKPAVAGLPVKVNHDIDRRPGKQGNRRGLQAAHRGKGQNANRNLVKGVRVQRRAATAMACRKCSKHVDNIGSATLPHNQSVGAHTQ